MINYQYYLKCRVMRASIDLRQFSMGIEEALRSQFSELLIEVTIGENHYSYSLKQKATNAQKRALGRKIAKLCKSLVQEAMKTVVYNNGDSISKQMFIAKK